MKPNFIFIETVILFFQVGKKLSLSDGLDFFGSSEFLLNKKTVNIFLKT